MISALDYLRELNMTAVLCRFFFACACGGIVGWGRGKAQHAAGLRTHLLVCVGAASTMILNQYLVLLYQSGDAARLGAQVISGIGFLGAGTILVRGDNHVTGLTTAAGLWASACMGLVIGSGFYEEAIVMLMILCLILFVLNKVDGRFLKTSHTAIYVECEPALPLSTILRVLQKEDTKVTAVQQMPGGEGAVLALKLNLERCAKGDNSCELLSALNSTQGIRYAVEL